MPDLADLDDVDDLDGAVGDLAGGPDPAEPPA
jgi:hypothetical protein